MYVGGASRLDVIQGDLGELTCMRALTADKQCRIVHYSILSNFIISQNYRRRHYDLPRILGRKTINSKHGVHSNRWLEGTLK